MKARGEGATLNGFLDKGSHLKGELVFEETFRIDGRFEGRIPGGSELILGDSAEVDAEIHVDRISMRIEEGAYFQGSCDMTAEPASRLVEMPATRK